MTAAASYRHRPIIVQAVRYDGRVDPPGVYRDFDRLPYVVNVHEQRVHVVAGDWIIIEPDLRHHRVVKAAEFAANYEAV